MKKKKKKYAVISSLLCVSFVFFFFFVAMLENTNSHLFNYRKDSNKFTKKKVVLITHQFLFSEIYILCIQSFLCCLINK